MNLLNNLFKNIFINLFLIIFLCFYISAQDNGEKDLITGKLPLQDFEINFKHYSGYLQVSKTKFLHYVLTKSQNNPEKAPLVLWLNGGPPCSSLLGLFIELGPYLLAQDGSKLIKNPSTWNNNANMLFLESPAGVGFSYSTDGNITSSDDETAKYNYEALKQFFNKFASFKGRPTVISGESYAGMYLPMLANLIIDGQKTFPINFKGVIIGNGELSKSLHTNTLPIFAYTHGIVDENVWQNFSKNCCKGCVDTCDVVSLTKGKGTCSDTANSIINSILNGPLDPYDIYGNCRQIPSKTSTRNNLKVVSKDEGFDQPIVPCVNLTAIRNYLNLPKVREVLHIPTNLSTKWQECSDDKKYSQQYDDMLKFMKNILKAKIPVMLYYGDTDAICNFLIGERFVTQLGIRLKTAKQPWIFENQVGGFVTEYDGLTLATVRGVGHIVLEWAPKRGLHILTQFLNNQPL